MEILNIRVENGQIYNTAFYSPSELARIVALDKNTPTAEGVYRKMSIQNMENRGRIETFNLIDPFAWRRLIKDAKDKK